MHSILVANLVWMKNVTNLVHSSCFKMISLNIYYLLVTINDRYSDLPLLSTQFIMQKGYCKITSAIIKRFAVQFQQKLLTKV